MGWAARGDPTRKMARTNPEVRGGKPPKIRSGGPAPVGRMGIDRDNGAVATVKRASRAKGKPMPKIPRRMEAKATSVESSRPRRAKEEPAPANKPPPQGATVREGRGRC